MAETAKHGLSYCPPDLIREILSRLPAPTLIPFKRVCKAWRDMIDDDPVFIRSHLDRQLLNPSDGGQLVFDDLGIINSYCLVPVGSLLAHTNPKEKIKATPLRHINPWKDRFDLAEEEDMGKFRVRSCNGIIFLSRVEGNTMFSMLWNPTTGESHELPTHTSTLMNAGSKRVSMVAGFGYDYTHDDYKVVNIATLFARENPRSFELETMVYGLKSDSWRRIKDFPYSTDPSMGYFLNGALHWFASTKLINDLIVGIDLVTENHFQVQIPLEIRHKVREARGSRQLLVLGGCISMACSYYDSADMPLDLWMMKDYRVESSWTKLFSIANSQKFFYLPVIYSKSRGIVLMEKRTRAMLGSNHWIPEYASLDLDNISSPKPKKVATVDVATSFSASSILLLQSLVRLKTTEGRRSSKTERDGEETSQ